MIDLISIINYQLSMINIVHPADTWQPEADNADYVIHDIMKSLDLPDL